MDSQLRQALTSRQPSFWIPIAAFLAFIVVGFVFLLTHRELPFESIRWKNDVNTRPQMVRDLLDNHSLVGKSRESIDTMLGVPTGRDSVRNDKYIYWAGSDGVIDDMWLEIEFVGDTVVSIRYVPD